jgi:hypothetical protein
LKDGLLSIPRTAAIAILVAAGLPVAGFLSGGRPIAAACVGVIGALWVFDRLRGPGWMTSIGMFGLTAGVVYGVVAGVAPLLSLVSLIAALAAWDLDRYARRIAGGEVRSGAILARQHARRLGMVAAASAALAGIALLARGGMGFWWLAPIAVAAFVALGRLVFELRRSGAEEG